LKKRINKNYKVFNLNVVKKRIIELGARKVEYIENYNIKNFKKINSTKKRFNIFISYYLKNIRLIDNI
jgi:pantothenate synthetase